MLGIESAVPQDARPCPLCLAGIEGHAALVFTAEGSLRWVHPLCAVKANGGVTAMRAGGDPSKQRGIRLAPEDLSTSDGLRIVHLADLHLGCRQYTATVGHAYSTYALGTNQREVDVARAFVAAITRVIALAPHVVLVAGDIFDQSKPSNNAIVLAQREFLRLRTALPDAVVVIVAGNHDTPKAFDLGRILPLFDALGVHVASTTAHRIHVPSLGLAILAVPDVPGVTPVLDPDPAAKYNVLVLHGELEHSEADDIHPWDYVALGHYHVHRVVAPRTCYAGALDYASSNPWGELAEESAAGVPGKGFVVYDLDDDEPQFVALPAQRAFIDLPPIAAAGLTPAEVDALIAAAVESIGGLDHKVVRLRVQDIPRDVSSALDRAARKRYRATALHFHLVCEKPAAAVTVGTSGASLGGRHMKSLDAMLAAAIDSRELGADVDRAELKRLAQSYLDQAAANEQDALTIPESAVA